MRKLFTVITAIILFLPSAGALSQEQQAANSQQQLQQLQQLLAQSKTGGGMQPTTQVTQALAQPSVPVTSQMQYLPTQLQQILRQGQAQPPTVGNVQAAAIPQSLLQSAAPSGTPAATAPNPAINTASTPQTTATSNSMFSGVSGGLQTPAAAQQSQVQDNAPTMYDKAFDNTINQLVPLSPDQIGKLHEVFDATQLAATTQAGVPAKPTTSSIIVNLSPQAAPPVIRLNAGYITSLVFMDGTGQPWPIDSYSIGNPGAFNIQWDKKGNTLLIQASSYYKTSNLAVILKDLNTPVMLTLLTGQTAVDYRVDLRVPGIGPNAMFTQSGLPDSANPILLDVLNGIPPKGSKALKVNGGACDAWILNNKLYLRTTLTLISPAWQATMNSIDGTHAYELQVAPVLLFVQHGKEKVLSLSVEGLE